MISLKSLTFSAIGRFVDEQTINFDALGSIVQIEGKNNNTGGSSGAAKSTIFKAIEFLFGINSVPSSVLQSRLIKNPITVSGTFDFDGLPLTIERGKKLSIDLNGEITTGSSKLTEEKLDQILGMPRELFRKILHKRQGEGGFFLDMGPSDTHKFLVDCLGLEKEQAKVLILDAKLLELETKQLTHETMISSTSAALEATKSAILGLGSPPALEIAPETLQELEKAHKYATEEHANRKTVFKSEMDALELTRPKIETVPFDRTTLTLLEGNFGTILSQISELEKKEIARQVQVQFKISDLQAKIRELEAAETNRQYGVKAKIVSNRSEYQKALFEANEGNKAKEKVVNLAEELKKVRASICPTCEQNWNTDAVKAKEAALLQKLQEYKKLVMDGNAATARLPEVTNQHEQLKLDSAPKSLIEVDAINAQIVQIQPELKSVIGAEVAALKLKSEDTNKNITSLRKEEIEHHSKEKIRSQAILDDFTNKQTGLRTYQEDSLRYLRHQENKAFDSLESAKLKIRFFEQAKDRFESTLNTLKQQDDKYQVQLSTTSKTLEETVAEIELATELKKAIKSYLSCSFEDALDSIGDMATQLIRSIPNMSTATIQLEGLKETKEGKIKEEVSCTISTDGEIGIPLKSLSGGERSSVDIGIDLSVIKFIQEQTGKGINIMILDEFTNGLDTVCIENAVEMLKNSNLDKKLLLVEHNPIISQSFENKLTVVRDGLTSKIVQQ